MLSSIRVRLTLWYLSVFGVLLIAFSVYIYSIVSRDMRKRFDAAVLRSEQGMVSYFTEFVEVKNADGGAQETVKKLREGRESAAIFREGQLLASNDQDVTAAVESTGALEAASPEGKPAYATDSKANRRLVVMPFQLAGVRYAIAVFEPLDKLESEIGQVRNGIMVGLPVALILAAAGGFLMAQKSLRPIVAISDQAEQINARNLNERLKVTNPEDELGRLAGVFNALLSRLDKSFGVMREFMADASHELRTPLTIIHGEAEVSLAHDHTAGEYKKSLGIISDQAKRMGRIVRDMLSLAQADAGEQKLRKAELYLNDLVEECCQAAQALAAPKHIRLSCESGEDVLIQGNEELLKRMVVNLVENAIRYTLDGGSVSVKLQSEASRAHLVVTDTGIGIPRESLERVFDRFYRVQDSRIRANGGSGLGLSIVKLAAESHQGYVEVESEPNRGSTFAVSLPL